MNRGEKKSTRIIHHTPPAIKLFVLMTVSFCLFLLPFLTIIIFALVSIFLLYFLAGFSLSAALQRLRPIWWLLIGLFLVGFLTQSWQQGLVTSLRLAAILLMANLLNLTTSTTQMMATFEHLFVFLKPFGVRPSRIALVLSLTLRFMPVLAQIAAQVREAQQARGLERSLTATIIPILIRMLQMGDDVANAIEARGYED